jgi:parallel beta-helix repeat protein
LADSNDVVIATWDNITGINGTGIAANAANVAYDPAGVSAVATTVQAKLRQIISVKDFGAVGDGATNDAAAIQAAINAASNNQTVLFPAGTYAVGSAGLLMSAKTDVTLLGQDAKIKLTAPATQTVLGSVTSIVLDSCTRSGIQNLEVDGNFIATQGIGLKACAECFVDNNTVYSCGISGQVVASGGGVRNRFTNNIVYSGIGASRGMWLGNVNATDMETDIYISGNIVRNNPASGIVVSSNGGRVIGNHARTNEGSGIVLPGANGYSAKNLTIANNYCIDNLFVGIQSDIVGYATPADLTTDISVSGNVCNFNRSGGIYAGDTERWVITGNTCTNNIFSGIQADTRSFNLTITGNACNDTRVGSARTQTSGIRITAVNENNYGLVICGNTCVNNIQYGIQIVTVDAFTFSNVAITGNNCYSNGITGIFVAEATLGAMINFVVTGNVCASNTTFDLRLTSRDVAIGPNRYATQSSVDFWDLASNSATPDIPGRTYWRANNSLATTITAFNSGVDGQQITIRAANGNTTIANGGLIVNKGAINVTLPADGTISYVRQNTVWREIFRSF